MNLADFYGPYQISNNKVFFKDVYKALDLTEDKLEIRQRCKLELERLEAEKTCYHKLLFLLNEREYGYTT